MHPRRIRFEHSAVLLALVSFALAAPPPVLAQHVSPPAVPQAPEGVQIGVAAAVHGQVQIASNGEAVGRIIESGRPIYMGDVVTTGPDSRLQVLLLDETVFTIGPDSAIVIDEFVFDPSTDDGRIGAEVVKGAFRFITGRIPHKQPQNMKVKLPAGTIGVRGTMVAGRVIGAESMVVLLGPGPNNRIGARPGAIDVSNAVDDVMHTVLVNQPGYGTTIGGFNAAPTAPAPVPVDVIRALEQELAAPEARPRGPSASKGAPRAGTTSSAGMTAAPEAGDPPSETDLVSLYEAGEITQNQLNEMLADREAWFSGNDEMKQALMEKYGSGGSMASLEPGMDTYDLYSTTSYQSFDPYATIDSTYETTTTASQDTLNTTGEILDGIASKAELASVQTGQFHYAGTGAFTQTYYAGSPVFLPGVTNVSMNIDFGARTIGGGSSFVQVNSTGGGGNIVSSMPITARDFNSGSDSFARYNQTNSTGDLHAHIEILNAGGIIGQSANVNVLYDDGLGNKGDGGVLDIQRQPGLQ